MSEPTKPEIMAVNAKVRGVAKNPKIENAFTYHAPKPGQPEVYERIRAEAKELAYIFEALCPDSRERSVAMTHLETAVFWANAAVARNSET